MRPTVYSLLVFILVLQFRFSEAESFGDTGRQEVLDYHNKVRSQVTHGNFVTKRKTKRPPGANMRKMVWNESLANSADKFARTNPKGHSNSVGIGENLYWHWASKPGDLNKFAELAAVSWIKEFKDLNWDSTVFTDEMFRSGVGHASQMVWAETDQLGCGYSTFQETHPKAKRLVTKVTVVCHYYPKGNFINEPIYVEGAPCSKCESKKCESGLCA